MFRTVPLSIIRSFFTVHSNGICHTGLLTACKSEKFVYLVGLIIKNTYINNILRVVTTATCFDTPASSSGSFINIYICI
jgi:hypothetical protein